MHAWHDIAMCERSADSFSRLQKNQRTILDLMVMSMSVRILWRPTEQHGMGESAMRPWDRWGRHSTHAGGVEEGQSAKRVQIMECSAGVTNGRVRYALAPGAAVGLTSIGRNLTRPPSMPFSTLRGREVEVDFGT